MLEQGKGKAISLPLTSDLVQLLQAYLAKFEKKNILEKQLDYQHPQQVLKPLSLKKTEDSESTGHPLPTQRVTYAKN